MAKTSELLKTELRTSVGSAVSRRLRRNGQTPVNIYGHGAAPVSLAVSSEGLTAALRGGQHVVSLDIDGQMQKALIKEIQYDAMGDDIIHVDFTRISEHERVEVTVPLQLVGQAPGVASGGVMTQPLHALHISCPADKIPDVLKLNISQLHIEQSLQVKDVLLPEGSQVLNSPEETVVVIHKLGEEAPAVPVESLEGEAAQPEVIGRKEKEEAEEAEEK